MMKCKKKKLRNGVILKNYRCLIYSGLMVSIALPYLTASFITLFYFGELIGTDIELLTI